MAKGIRISLANKCQLLFGAAVILILTAALAVPWLRMQTLVVEGQQETARRLAGAWLNGKIELGFDLVPVERLTLQQGMIPGQQLTLTLIDKDEFDLLQGHDPFVWRAIATFQTRPDRHEAFTAADDRDGTPYYRFVRAIRRSDLSRIRRGEPAGFGPAVDVTALADPLEMVLLLHLRAETTERQLWLNRAYILAAGVLAGLLAIGAFWFVTMRIILSPVRILRDTAEKVSEGDLNIRSQIGTGDEFEQLSDMFNAMLESLKANRDELHAANKSLDLKLGQLAQTNVALYEANKIKGDFLANVSHELRTPLHSMVGFAEVLGETLEGQTSPIDEKRKRYVANIITASRRLLDLINELLDLAKIEAGRMELHVSPVSVADTAEGLLNLIRPQAERHQIELRLKIDPKLPVVHTDASRFQQILFNFLSNAVKFTPEGGSVTLTAHPLPAASPNAPSSVRVSVTDTGPGIALEDHHRIFEKFVQLDVSVTREHDGTGLGLTISQQLAELIHGQIDLDSDVGKGATFSLTVPVELKPRTAPLMPENVPAPE